MKNTPKPILAFALLLIGLSLYSCRKDTADCTTNAVILDQGVEAADGCGWVVRIANTDFHVDNLPTAYQQNNLNVRIGFEADTARHYVCGIAALPMPTIKLKCIERQ